MTARAADILARKIERFSIPSRVSAREAHIILAEPGDSLDDAFAFARELASRYPGIRLIGPGVTLRRAWPDWMWNEERISLTEWGALRYGSLAGTTQELQRAMREWIDELAGDLFEGPPADRVLFAGACLRFFQRVVVAYPVGHALALAFPGTTIHLVSDDPLRRALIADLARPGGGCVSGPPRGPSSSRWWGVRMATLASFLLAASIGHAIASYLQARRSLREIARLRRRPGLAPATWVGLVPDWYRIGHHLLHAFAIPETDDGIIGVLLIGTLATGLRDETNMRRHHPSEHIWPGLGPLTGRLDRIVVEQAVMPDSPQAFLAALVSGALRSLRLVRALARDPVLRLAPLELPHGSWARRLAVWATADVVRATLAQAAARSLSERVAFAGATVALTSANRPEVAAVDLALQAAGATTIEHAHGFSHDSWTGHGAASSSLRSVWTNVEGHPSALPGQANVVTGMPEPLMLGPRGRVPQRILIMSNYTHRDTVVAGSHPFRVFQQELLAMVPLLKADGRSDAHIRWRPHPADDPGLVARDAQDHPGLVVSRGVPLAEDVGWADVIVSSVSTTVIETLFAAVPVFVHVLPEFWETYITSFLDPSRLFLHAEAGARAVTVWMRQYATRPQDGLEPEMRARRVLFGDVGHPVPMSEYVGRRRVRPMPRAS